jgi:acetylornithine/succinyldiaminopimelate/putrescine aminotransferase
MGYRARDEECAMSDMMALEERFGASNYAPLPVVLTRGEGVWLWDVEGRRYLDMLSAYSAVSFGYGHPRLLAALESQARRLAVTSRAFHSDRLPPFLARVCEVTGMDRALPMSTGAEAVETAIKCVRKWAYPRARPRSCAAPATSTAGRRPSWASPPSASTASISAPSAAASWPFRSATRGRWRP